MDPFIYCLKCVKLSKTLTPHSIMDFNKRNQDKDFLPREII